MQTLSSPGQLDYLEMGGGDTQLRAQLEAACHLLAYAADALHATGANGTGGGGVEPACGGLPAWESPGDPAPDADWADDQQDEDDTSADDSVRGLINCFVLSRDLCVGNIKHCSKIQEVFVHMLAQ